MSDGYEGGTPPPDGPRNLAGAINGTNLVVFPLSWVSVILRVISRVWISHNFGWDDAMMVFCQVTNTVGLGLVLQETQWGLGRHRYYLKTDNYTGFLKYDYLDWCQVFITLCTCKLAIAMFLLRISKFKQWRGFLYGLIIFLLLSHVPITFAYIFQCRPVNRAWDADRIPGACFTKAGIQDLIIVQGVTSIVSDVILAAFPVILIRNMKLPPRQKLALQLLMGLGIVTAIACLIRTVFSYQIKAEDKTWQGIPNALCRIFEINLGIIAANAPMMRPLWNYCKRRYRAHMLLHRNNSDNENNDNTDTRPTPEGNMQWYRPPNERYPWYRRVHRHFQWNIRPPISQTSSTQTMNKRHSPESDAAHAEKVTLPPPHPYAPKPRATSLWPQAFVSDEKEAPPTRAQSHDIRQQQPKKSFWSRRPPVSRNKTWALERGGVDAVDERDRPENATWNKDDPSDPPRPRRTSESFDLPLQGAKNDEWMFEERERMREWAAKKRREQEARKREQSRGRFGDVDWGGGGGGGGGGPGTPYRDIHHGDQLALHSPSRPHPPTSHPSTTPHSPSRIHPSTTTHNPTHPHHPTRTSSRAASAGPHRDDPLRLNPATNLAREVDWEGVGAGGGHVILAGSGSRSGSGGMSGSVSRSGSGSTATGGGGGGRRQGHKAQPSWPLPG